MKFSIRDIMLVTVIVALGLGWWLDRSTLVDANQKRFEAQEQKWDDDLYRLEIANWKLRHPNAQDAELNAKP